MTTSSHSSLGKRFELRANTLIRRYRNRRMDRETCTCAENLLKDFFHHDSKPNASLLTEVELQAISRSSEVLDYFNVFDKTFPFTTPILRLSEQMFHLVATMNRQAPAGLWRERIRVAALSFSEEYRLRQISESQQGLTVLVDIAENNLLNTGQHAGSDGMLANYACLGYLNFWLAKTYRGVDFAKAERIFETAYTYFLKRMDGHLAALSELKTNHSHGKRSRRVSGQPQDELTQLQEHSSRAQQSLFRLGVVDTARAALLVSFGKVQEAEVSASRALVLLSPGDVLTRAYTKLLLGTCARLQAKPNSERMASAITLLNEAFTTFMGEKKNTVASPRLGVRTIRHLVYAHLLNQDTKSATRCIRKVELAIARNHSRFEKLAQNTTWQMQWHLLNSRIMRKDAERSGEERKYNQAISLAQKGAALAGDVDPFEQCDAYITLGEVLFCRGDYDRAGEAFKEALQRNSQAHGAGESWGNPEIIGVANLFLARIEIRKGRLGEIVKHYSSYNNVRDRIFNEWVHSLAGASIADSAHRKRWRVDIPIDPKPGKDLDYYWKECRWQLHSKLTEIAGGEKAAAHIIGINLKYFRKWGEK